MDTDAPVTLQTCLSESQLRGQIPVTPRAFKAILQSLIEFLQSRSLAATLWLKLPKEEAWWEDIRQYCQQLAEPRVYLLGLEPSWPTAPDRSELPYQTIALRKDDLKGEYLCLAIADNFACGLLAFRRIQAPGEASRRNLSLVCFASPGALQSIGQGLQSLLHHSPAGQALLTQNAGGLATELASSAALIDDFLSWQLRAQNDLRATLAEARKADSDLVPSSKPGDSIDRAFLDAAGQELRTPLTTIKTALTLLNSPNLKPPQRQRYLDMIRRECDRQSALVTSAIELLQVQTAAPPQLQPLQLGEIVPGVVSTYQPLARERSITLAYTIAANLPPAAGVEPWLRQILINLINNGIRFTANGGSVRVTAAQSGDRIALAVEDTGTGIGSADLPRVFDAFFRRLPVEGLEGIGLGLTMAQQLLQQMGGVIQIKSSPGRGSRFTAMLLAYSE